MVTWIPHTEQGKLCHITCAKYRDSDQPVLKNMEFSFVTGLFGISSINYVDPQLTERMPRPGCVSHCFGQWHERQGTFVGEVSSQAVRVVSHL